MLNPDISIRRPHLSFSVDIGNDLNAELSRVVSELEDAIGETRKLTADSADPSSPANPGLEGQVVDKVCAPLPQTTLEETSEQVPHHAIIVSLTGMSMFLSITYLNDD